jgi:hypothetical protein
MGILKQFDFLVLKFEGTCAPIFRCFNSNCVVKIFYKIFIWKIWKV